METTKYTPVLERSTY